MSGKFHAAKEDSFAGGSSPALPFKTNNRSPIRVGSHSTHIHGLTMNTDAPKSLKDLTLKAERLSQIHDQHVIPLTRFVEELRTEAGPGVEIPYFDPWDGGAEAEILLLLEAPGPKAVASSFISRNNPDETAKNIFELTSAAGIDRKETVLWNVVPWYIGSGTKIRAATPKDLELGLRPLPRLLSLLPKLRAVVLLGKKAEKAAALITSSHQGIRIFHCGHPSPLYVNNAPGNREKLLQTLTEAKKHLQAQYG